jgi:hypothetical protein
VSPPWCAETHLQGRYRKHAGDCRRWAGGRYCNRGRREASVVFRVTGRWHCECASANHGGLTPPALVLHECVSAGDLRFPLHARYPTTGGLRPPLLAVHAFVHRKSRHFTGTRSRLQTGAAGVSPPWCAETHLQGRYRKRGVRETAAAGLANVIAIAVAGEASVVFRVTGRWHCECASANHGGLTPPALGCRSHVAERCSFFPARGSCYLTTGG